MNLLNYIKEAFVDGLTYDEAAQLCLRLYCNVEGLPETLKEQCNKNNLAEVFAALSASGFIKGSTVGAVLYGANFHEVFEKGHWVEVIASIFKKGNTANMELREEVFQRLTLRSSSLPPVAGTRPRRAP
jgi:hypothetical protein